jgi:hypothetical protein
VSKRAYKFNRNTKTQSFYAEFKSVEKVNNKVAQIGY